MDYIFLMINVKQHVQMDISVIVVQMNVNNVPQIVKNVLAILIVPHAVPIYVTIAVKTLVL